jgi:peptide/nickel transport system permease protein
MSSTPGPPSGPAQPGASRHGISGDCDPIADVATQVSEVPGTLTAGEAAAAGLRPRGMLRRGWEVFAPNRMALAGVGNVLFFTGFCFIGPVFYHTNQTSTNLSDYLCRPGGGHPLGCTDVGYDELGRLMLGGQASIEVGVAAALLASTVGTLYGAISGYAGGIVDTIMMRVVDAWLSIPSLFVLIILSVIFHPDPLVMILIIAVFYWLLIARLVRGETLSLRTREYVQAVKVAGGRNVRAITRHIIPNAIGTIIVQATFGVADSILILAALGYLGLGIQPPATDWGAMLSSGITYVDQGYWWLIYPPGLCIILVVVAFNFIGDALRDAFETRLQRR